MRVFDGGCGGDGEIIEGKGTQSVFAICHGLGLKEGTIIDAEVAEITVISLFEVSADTDPQDVSAGVDVCRSTTYHRN